MTWDAHFGGRLGVGGFVETARVNPRAAVQTCPSESVSCELSQNICLCEN